MLNWIARHRFFTLTLLSALLVLSVVISANSGNLFCRFILDYFDNWAQVYRTIGTLVAAYLAYIAIAEGRRIREEDREHEHKRRSLDSIIDWAKGVQRQCLMRGSLRNMDGVEAAVVAGDWAVMTAETFGEDFKSIVDKARKDLTSCVAVLPDTQTMVSPEALLDSVNRVLEAAYRLKITYKL